MTLDPNNFVRGKPEKKASVQEILAEITEVMIGTTPFLEWLKQNNGTIPLTRIANPYNAATVNMYEGAKTLHALLSDLTTAPAEKPQISEEEKERARQEMPARIIEAQDILKALRTMEEFHLPSVTEEGIKIYEKMQAALKQEPRYAAEIRENYDTELKAAQARIDDSYQLILALTFIERKFGQLRDTVNAQLKVSP